MLMETLRRMEGGNRYDAGAVMSQFDAVMSSIPPDLSSTMAEDVRLFRMVFSRDLDERLPPHMLGQMVGSFWLCISSLLEPDLHDDDEPDARGVYEDDLQNYAHYLFPDYCGIPEVEELLRMREIRLDMLRELVDRSNGVGGP